ncbi:hypothetical protein [Deinococcus sp.]|uniref:hypothetical protein n=1 Tax=Deinococcus sp. TaxID=47478 RepID=UPI003CC6541E
MRTVPASIALLTLPLVTMLGLAACGSTTSAPPAADAGLTRAAALALSGSARSGTALLAQLMVNPTDLGALAGVTAQSAPAGAGGLSLRPQVFSCAASSTPAQPTDADRDLIPLTTTFAIDCSVSDDITGAGFGVKGAANVSDSDDNDARSGYSVSISNLHLFGSTGFNSASLTLNLGFTLLPTTSGYSVSSVYSLDTSTPQNGTSTLSYSLSGVSYLPDSARSPRLGGTWNGSGSAASTRAGHTLALNMTASNLHFNPACTGRFDGGSVSYGDLAGNTLTLSYPKCGAVNASYNGAALN